LSDAEYCWSPSVHAPPRIYSENDITRLHSVLIYPRWLFIPISDEISWITKQANSNILPVSRLGGQVKSANIFNIFIDNRGGILYISTLTL
jgi:hypothetical protein